MSMGAAGDEPPTSHLCCSFSPYLKLLRLKNSL